MIIATVMAVVIAFFMGALAGALLVGYATYTLLRSQKEITVPIAVAPVIHYQNGYSDGWQNCAAAIAVRSKTRTWASTRELIDDLDYVAQQVNG